MPGLAVSGDGGDFMYASGKDHNGESYTYFPLIPWAQQAARRSRP